MRNLFVKTIISSVVWIACSMPLYAQDNNITELFKTNCAKKWMEKAGNVTDKVEYQNFGEKFCSCLADKPLDNDSAIGKSVQMCMSRTILHDAMDTLEDEEELSELTQDSLQKTCLDKWKFLSTNLNAEAQKQVSNYCQCATPKLIDMNNNRESLTDKEWADKIDTIADSCADKVDPDKSVATDAKKG